MEWIKHVLASPEFGLAVLPASVFLGLLTAVSSSCNLGIVAAIAGYAGSRGDDFQRRDALLMSVFFLVGTICSLAVLGLLVGYFGKLAGDSLGRYALAVIGFASIVFGLIALDLAPFKLPSIDLSKRKFKGGVLGAILFGLLVGAASVTCTIACCGPLLPVVLGLAAARGQSGWGALILTMFAIGYSLPLAVLMLGIGLGRTATIARAAVKPIRIGAGIMLVVVGFWLLATL